MAAKKQARRAEKAPVPVHSRLAPKVEGAEFTEIKATIEGPKIAAALKAFSLSQSSAEQRFVYFFDTAKLALNKARVVVRARRVPGKQHDSTIKIRPVDPGEVTKWKKIKGFKIEADAGSSGIVLSASLTRPVAKGVIKKLETGDGSLDSIFDDDQERFLAQMCRISYKLSSLQQFGPIDVLWWKQEYPGLPAPMTAELWTRADGEKLLELSIRVPSGIAAFSSGGFLAFLADLGAKPDNASQAKTKWAMASTTPTKKPAEKPSRGSAKTPVAPKRDAKAEAKSQAARPATAPAEPKPKSKPKAQRPRAVAAASHAVAVALANESTTPEHTPQ